ncbi:MAG: MMPL family transporter [Pseudomonadota bacterium]|nr:MMPL family transporter [Pseudomonadota bacterium]
MKPFSFVQLKLIALLIVLAAGALSICIPGIQYRSEITDYFQQDNPDVINFHKLEANFGLQQSLLVLLHSQDQSFVSGNGINTLYGLVQSLEALEGINRSQSLLNTAISSQQDTRSVYRHLKRQGLLSDSVLGQVADNVSRGTLVSADGSVASIQLYFSSEDYITELYPVIQDMLQRQFVQAGLGEVKLLGPVEIKHALHQALLHDGFYLMPLVLLAGLGVLWYFLRSWWLVVSGAASIIVALWLTAGMVGWFKLSINQTSALAFCIAFIIALADIIHLLMSFTHQDPALPRQQAMLQALRSNFVSLFLTSLTTGIGFLSLNGSSSPVFATFGNIAAIGVACAFVAAISITPVLAVLRNTHARSLEPDVFQRWSGNLNRFRNQLQTRHYALFYIGSIGLSACVLLNTYHNDPLDYFESDSSILQATRLSEQAFGIHHPVSIMVDSKQKDGIYQPDFLRALRQFETWLDAHPQVSHHNSYLAVLTQLKRHLHQNNVKWNATPTSAAEVADLWNLYEMSAPGNTPQTLGLDKSFQSAVVSVGVPKLRSTQLLQLEQDILLWFQTNAPEYHISVTGHAILFAGIGKALTSNMFIGGLLSAMVISLLIGLFLRNLRVGLLCLIPNLFPAGIIYGVWGATVGVIDIAAAGTLSISLGIVVDDTIHILKRYLGHREAGLPPQISMERTFEEVGSALMLTTLILCLGMLVLTLSIFGPNQTTAILMASIILVALIYDLVMLPHLLEKLDGWLFAGYRSSSSAAELTAG